MTIISHFNNEFLYWYLTIYLSQHSKLYNYGKYNLNSDILVYRYRVMKQSGGNKRKRFVSLFYLKCKHHLSTTSQIPFSPSNLKTSKLQKRPTLSITTTTSMSTFHLWATIIQTRGTVWILLLFHHHPHIVHSELPHFLEHTCA